MVDKVLASFKKTKFKTCAKRWILCSNQHSPTNIVQICFEKLCDSVSNNQIQIIRYQSIRYDPESFLFNSKQPITNLIINTRQTKVKLILLSCMMEKVDLKTGGVIAKEAAFHSKTEVNVESTNSNELFSKMKETFLES